MSIIQDELRRLDEARGKGAITAAMHKKLRQQILDLVEDAELVSEAEPVKPPEKPRVKPVEKPRVEKPRVERVEVALEGEILEDTPKSGFGLDAAIAGLVVVAGTLLAGWLLGDLILALTIVLAAFALVLIQVARRLVAEDREPELEPEQAEM